MVDVQPQGLLTLEVGSVLSGVGHLNVSTNLHNVQVSLGPSLLQATGKACLSPPRTAPR
jgi:hypothetical protein